MRPHFNPHGFNPSNQPQPNGTNNSAPQQIMGNPGNFFPNPMQMMPQFQMGMLNNPQLAIPPFTNPNAFFNPAQMFPFQQAQLQSMSGNGMQHRPFLHNGANVPPQFLANGQFNVPSLMQSVNQLMQMQMQMPMANGQLGLVNGNGGLQGAVNGMPNAQLGLVNGNGGLQPTMNGNGVLQPTMNVSGPMQVKANAAMPQGNVGENGWKSPHNKNSSWNPKHDASQRGFNKQQFHHKQNTKRNFGFNDNQVQDQENDGVKNFNHPGSGKPNLVEKKRPPMVNYTPQEIQQWREARKKFYPSKANIEKKLKVNEAEPEVTDAVKARRQQLKEILAKQAELGCEVAEIPPSYISDSEQHAGNGGANRRQFDKRGRFQNKFDKRGKNQQNNRFPQRQRPGNHSPANQQNGNDRFAKKPRWTNGNTSNQHRDNQTKPSLLKKLLSADIKRDKIQLLQVFRFMVMNSFFKNSPEKPLKFPEVIVREESGAISEIVEEIPHDEEGEITD